MKRLLFLLVIIISFLNLLYSQEKEDSKYKNIDFELDYEEGFETAIPLILKQLEQNPDVAHINYKLGFCYLHSSVNKQKAIIPLEKAFKSYLMQADKMDSAVFAAYYLSRAYHYNHEFKKAIETLKITTDIFANDPFLEKEIELQTKRCSTAIDLMKKPVNMSVRNFGSVINSKYDDRNPVFSADERVLFFTSRRKGTTGSEKITYGQYFEDIYFSKNDGNNWQKPVRLSSNINTEGNEAVVGVSPDAQQLLIYRAGDLYFSQLSGDEWSVPEKLPAPINSDAKENHASISADGNTLYFTSNRKGGFGGFDIYVATKNRAGQWSNVKNMGRKINTSLNEATPYIHPNGNTLYFSSEGHNSMGEFDVFKSDYSDKQWNIPQNMGYPLNTTGDDLFFVPTADGHRAYYSSVREDGFGQSDIYHVLFDDSEEVNLTILSGYLTEKTGDTRETYQIKYYANEIELDDDNILIINAMSRYINNNEDVFIDISAPVGGEYSKYSNKRVEDVKQRFIKNGVQSEFIFTDLSQYDVEGNNVTITVFDKTTLEALIGTKEVNTFVEKIDNKSKRKKLLSKFKNQTATNISSINAVKEIKKKENTAEDLKTSGVILPIEDKIEEFPIINKNIVHYQPINFNIVVVENILFGANQHTTKKYNKNLDLLAKFLTDNPKAIIEVGGHSDKQGRRKYNIELAQKRVEFIRNYLKTKGVNTNQCVIKNYGIDDPIANILNPDRSFNWSALNYNRRVEIKLLRNDTDSLLVKQIPVPLNLRIAGKFDNAVTDSTLHLVIMQLKESVRNNHNLPKGYVNENLITINNIADKSLNTTNINISKKVDKEDVDVIDDEEYYVYSIVLLVSETKAVLSTFADIDRVKERKGEGGYMYYFGSFTNQDEAEKEAERLRTKYPNAYVFINDSF